jgi:hypothetical protein
MSIRLSRRSEMRCIAMACLSLFAFAGCAFDESEEPPSDGETSMADGMADQEEFDQETAELEGQSPPTDSPAVAGEVELTEESVENARPTVAPDDATVAGEAEGAALADTAALPRYRVGDGACHTFHYLRTESDRMCRDYFGLLAVERNYTHGCTGWWGDGAVYVWFTCDTGNGG